MLDLYPLWREERMVRSAERKYKTVPSTATRDVTTLFLDLGDFMTVIVIILFIMTFSVIFLLEIRTQPC